MPISEISDYIFSCWDRLYKVSRGTSGAGPTIVAPWAPEARRIVPSRNLELHTKVVCNVVRLDVGTVLDLSFCDELYTSIMPTWIGIAIA